MKIPHVNRSTSLEFNLTPMIDIVFLLIIFFLVASHFVAHTKEEAIELPDSTQAKMDEEEETPFVITVTPQGYSMGEEQLSLEQVVARMQLAEVNHEGEAPIEWKIRADANAEYRLLQPVIIACAKFPESRMKLAVESRK